MRKLFIGIVLFIIVTSGYSQVKKTQNYDVRNVRWGMSESQIKLREKAKFLFKAADILFYKGTVLGYNADISYLLINDSLVSVMITLKPDNIENNKYIEDFKKIENSVSEKYGHGNKEIIWINDLFKDDPDRIGLALASEQVQYKTSWANSKSSVFLLMSGKSYKISIGLSFIAVNKINSFLNNWQQSNDL